MDAKENGIAMIFQEMSPGSEPDELQKIYFWDMS